VPLDVSRWKIADLRAEWCAARPFAHVILDDFLPAADLAALREAVAREAHYANTTDFYEVMASELPPRGERLTGLARELDGARRFFSDVSNKPLGRVDLRSYVYLGGSFLLPHSDAGADAMRQVAWAYYLLPRSSSTGGELELFDCAMHGDEIIAATSGKLIEPVENRFVFFDVTPASLHQVREVTSGGRVSLSGWFYP
jgi:Rps23 Pro-64 3,4-dihydroxylase Tpa1-like proline 4-hydroxylase